MRLAFATLSCSQMGANISKMRKQAMIKTIIFIHVNFWPITAWVIEANVAMVSIDVVVFMRAYEDKKPIIFF